MKSLICFCIILSKSFDTTGNTSTGRSQLFWTKKHRGFLRPFRIKIILGWNLYLSIALSIGLEISFDDLLVMNLFSLIFNVDTAFLKNLFSSFAIRSSSCNTSSFSTSLICDPWFPLFENNVLIVFQNNLLSVTKDRSKLLKNCFLSFLYSLLQKFFCSLYALKLFSNLF